MSRGKTKLALQIYKSAQRIFEFNPDNVGDLTKYHLDEGNDIQGKLLTYKSSITDDDAWTYIFRLTSNGLYFRYLRYIPGERQGENLNAWLFIPRGTKLKGAEFEELLNEIVRIYSAENDDKKELQLHALMQKEYDVDEDYPAANPSSGAVNGKIAYIRLGKKSLVDVIDDDIEQSYYYDYEKVLLFYDDTWTPVQGTMEDLSDKEPEKKQIVTISNDLRNSGIQVRYKKKDYNGNGIDLVGNVFLTDGEYEFSFKKEGFEEIKKIIHICPENNIISQSDIHQKKFMFRLHKSQIILQDEEGKEITDCEYSLRLDDGSTVSWKPSSIQSRNAIANIQQEDGKGRLKDRNGRGKKGKNKRQSQHNHKVNDNYGEEEKRSTTDKYVDIAESDLSSIRLVIGKDSDYETETGKSEVKFQIKPSKDYRKEIKLRKKEKEYSFTINKEELAGKHAYDDDIRFTLRRRGTPQSSPLYGYRLRQDAEGKYSLLPCLWNKLFSSKTIRKVLIIIFLILMIIIAAASFVGGTKYGRPLYEWIYGKTETPTSQKEEEVEAEDTLSDADIQRGKNLVEYIEKNSVWKETVLDTMGCKEFFDLMNHYKLKDLQEYMDWVNDECNIPMSKYPQWKSLYDLVREKKDVNIPGSHNPYCTDSMIKGENYRKKISSFK